MKNFFIKFLVIAVCALIAIQFFKSKKDNVSNDDTYHVRTKYKVSPEVEDILEIACYDCHSNKSVYPKYFDYQPGGWLLNNHIHEGKKHLNFSEFTKLPLAVQNHKFEETIEMIKEKKMPIASYTYFGLHPEAKLTEDQRAIVIKWAQAQMDTLKANYPPDSLILRRRR